MRVKATTDLFYGSRDYKTGDEFDTENDMHGTALMMAGKVVEVVELVETGRRGNYKRRDMRASK